MREPGLRRRSREWIVARLSKREAEPDDAGVLATYAVTALVWSLATVGVHGRDVAAVLLAI